MHMSERGNREVTETDQACSFRVKVSSTVPPLSGLIKCASIKKSTLGHHVRRRTRSGMEGAHMEESDREKT